MATIDENQFKTRPETSCNGRGWDKFPPGFAEMARSEIIKVLGGNPNIMPDLDILENQSDVASENLKKTPVKYLVDERVVLFLGKLELLKYQAIFEKEEIDYDTLKDIKENEMETIGIPLGPRKKIVKELAKGVEIVVPRLLHSNSNS
jgi:hypothetical protein